MCCVNSGVSNEEMSKRHGHGADLLQCTHEGAPRCRFAVTWARLHGFVSINMSWINTNLLIKSQNDGKQR